VFCVGLWRVSVLVRGQDSVLFSVGLWLRSKVMSNPRFAIVVLVALFAAAPGAQGPAVPKSTLVERVGDIGFIQLEARSFATLTDRQKELAYWLSQASIAIDPVAYDQLSRWGLRQKRLLEGIVSHPDGVPPATFAKVREYALLFWANRGNHNETTAQKFLPEFSFEDLQAAALKAQANGAFASASGDLRALATADAVKKELGDLKASIFDASFEPMMTVKTPPPGQDILQASSNTFYQGVSLEDLKNFQERYPLNSRVVKDSRGIRELVYRAGTPDGKVPPGLYATYLKKVIGYLEKARNVAEPAQAAALGDLIRFYQTGDPKDWLRFGGKWVRNDAVIDFSNGFVEVYRDPRGAKGAAQGFVTITDQPVSNVMVNLAKNAAYFEDKAPWNTDYKKRDFTPPVVKAVEVLIETGDFHVGTVGVNLPNEQEIHAQYGTKNFRGPRVASGGRGAESHNRGSVNLCPALMRSIVTDRLIAGPHACGEVVVCNEARQGQTKPVFLLPHDALPARTRMQCSGYRALEGE